MRRRTQLRYRRQNRLRLWKESLRSLYWRRCRTWEMSRVALRSCMKCRWTLWRNSLRSRSTRSITWRRCKDWRKTGWRTRFLQWRMRSNTLSRSMRLTWNSFGESMRSNQDHKSADCSNRLSFSHLHWTISSRRWRSNFCRRHRTLRSQTRRCSIRRNHTSLSP